MILLQKNERKEENKNGYFSHYERLDMEEAWSKYGRGNGRKSLKEMEASLQGMRSRNNLQISPEIGCIILRDLVFFDQWINEPTDWNKSIVSGKTYSTDSEIGKRLYNTVLERIEACTKSDNEIIEDIDKEIENYQLEGQDRVRLIKTRVNQSVFRDRLLRWYNTCCLCKVENKSLLVASHIKPWTESSAKEKLDVENGLLLCPNHDALFDKGYISFSDDGNIIISNELSDIDCVFTNINKDMSINVSDKTKEYMKFHRENIYKS